VFVVCVCAFSKEMIPRREVLRRWKRDDGKNNPDGGWKFGKVGVVEGFGVVLFLRGGCLGYYLQKTAVSEMFRVCVYGVCLPAYVSECVLLFYYCFLWERKERSSKSQVRVRSQREEGEEVEAAGEGEEGEREGVEGEGFLVVELAGRS
jgi:hypothetical protein